MSKQKKENTNKSIHLKKEISFLFKLNLSVSNSAVIFLKRLFHTRKYCNRNNIQFRKVKSGVLI